MTWIDDDDGGTPLEREIERQEGLARTTDPGTSHEAARLTDATRLMAAVLECLRRHPDGLTSEEVATRTWINLQSASPRFKPLERLGLIERTSERRPGHTGRSRIVWRAKP